MGSISGILQTGKRRPREVAVRLRSRNNLGAPLWEAQFPRPALPPWGGPAAEHAAAPWGNCVSSGLSVLLSERRCRAGRVCGLIHSCLLPAAFAGVRDLTPGRSGHYQACSETRERFLGAPQRELPAAAGGRVPAPRGRGWSGSRGMLGFNLARL